MYKKIKKKFRNLLAGRTVSLSVEQCRNLRFFQYNVGTVEYFRAKSSSFDIRIADIPHFLFVRGLHEHVEDNGGERHYREYLCASWGGGDYEGRIDKFRQHYRHFLNKGPASEPIITSLPGVAGLLVVDGNHRASMAGVTGSLLSVRYVPYRRVLLNYSCLRRFFKGAYLQRVVRLAENTSDPIWGGEFKQLFDFLSFAKVHRCSVLDASGIPCLLEALHFRHGLKGGMSIFYDRRLANFSLRTLVLRGLYPNFSAVCVGDQSIFDGSFNFVICTEGNVQSVLDGYNESLAVMSRLVVLSTGRALSSVQGWNFLASEKFSGNCWGAIFEIPYLDGAVGGL